MICKSEDVVSVQSKVSSRTRFTSVIQASQGKQESKSGRGSMFYVNRTKKLRSLMEEFDFLQ